MRSPPRKPWGWIAVAAAGIICAATLWIVNGLRPVEPLRVLSLDVERFATLGKRAQPQGILGKRTYSARLDDQVTVRAALSRPAYAYLIAFRPDGTDELCFPEDMDETPPLTDRPCYPSVSREEQYGLNEGIGLWIFAVVASDNPLPPYREWRSKQPLPPWPKAQSKVKLPSSSLVLWDDGQWVESLTPTGNMRGARAKGVAAGGKSAIVRITDWLKRGSRSNATGAIGFVVTPKE